MDANRTTMRPNTTNTDNNNDLPSIIHHQVVYLSIVAVIGALTNLVVLVKSIQYERRLKTTTRFAKNSTNFLVISLALSDLGTCTFSIAIFVLPFHVSNFPLTNFFCKYVQSLRELFIGVSVYCIAFIALGRYLILLKAFRKVRRLFSSTFIYSVVIWVSCYLLFALPFSSVYKLESEDGTFACEASWKNASQKRLHINWILVGNVLLPTIMVSFSYLGIIRQLRKARMIVIPEEIAADSGSKESMALTVQSVRIVKLSIVLLLCFCVTFLPFATLMVAIEYGNSNVSTFPRLDVLHAVALCLVYTSAAINPLIIMFSSDTYRMDPRQLLKCCRCTFLFLGNKCNSA